MGILRKSVYSFLNSLTFFVKHSFCSFLYTFILFILFFARQHLSLPEYFLKIAMIFRPPSIFESITIGRHSFENFFYWKTLQIGFYVNYHKCYKRTDLQVLFRHTNSDKSFRVRCKMKKL